MQTLQLFPNMPKYDITPASEEIYQAYPRKVAKCEAMAAIHRAIKKHGYEHVLKRTKEFSEAWGTSGKPLAFVPYPATFFNQERYQDDYAAIFPADHVARPVNGISLTQQKRAIEQLLESNEKDLKRFLLPDASRYLNGQENRKYQADLQTAITKRAGLKEERKNLEIKLKEVNKRIAQ